MYTVEEIAKKNEWEQFLLKERGVPTPFFQSWNWGEVQQNLGNKIFRLGLFKNEKLIGICLAVLIKARRGIYLHLRHGPVLNDLSELKAFIKEIRKIASNQNASFIRLSPLIPLDSKEKKVLKELDTRNSPVHNMDAENTWILDLSKNEETLMQEMRKTTRYLVRKAEKMQIIIKKTTDEQDFKEFFKLYNETSVRHHFVPHKGIKAELDILSKDDEALLFLALHDKKLIAGSIIIFYGNQAVYHHGASDDKYRDIPGSYLIQWEAIKEAKKRGKKYYNFWGVVPPDKPKHPWQGITLFKTGFGGMNTNYVHAQDIPLKISYWKTFAIETVWRIRRGY